MGYISIDSSKGILIFNTNQKFTLALSIKKFNDIKVELNKIKSQLILFGKVNIRKNKIFLKFDLTTMTNEQRKNFSDILI